MTPYTRVASYFPHRAGARGRNHAFLMASRASILTLAVVALSAGCFDDAGLHPTDDLGAVDVPKSPTDAPDGAADAATPPDAGLDADVPDADDAGFDVGKDGAPDDADAPDAATPACTLDRVLVTTSNFVSGGYALGRFAPTPSLVASSVMAPDQDHVPVQSGCVVYNLLRGNDVLAVLDPSNLPNVARLIPLRMGGDGGARYQVNPYDVYTYAPNKAYVVQYALSRIAVVDPTREGADAVLRSIDLSPVRSPDDRDASGSPEPAAIVRAGRHVFVALQNLNAFAPVTNGTLAVIDPATDTLLDIDGSTPAFDAVRLTGRNPVAMDVTRGGRLVVVEAGVVVFTPPQMLDGGIELIDPVTYRPSGFLVTEAQLGGDIKSLVMLDESRAWVVVTQLMAGGASSERVVEVNLDAPAGSRIGSTIVSTGSIGAIARDPIGNVWVLDRTTGRAGARVFNPLGMEVTTAPLSSGMYPPAGIAFVP